MRVTWLYGLLAVGRGRVVCITDDGRPCVCKHVWSVAREIFDGLVELGVCPRPLNLLPVHFSRCGDLQVWSAVELADMKACIYTIRCCTRMPTDFCFYLNVKLRP